MKGARHEASPHATVGDLGGRIVRVGIRAAAFAGSVSAAGRRDKAPSPWLLVPVFSSSPKLGTAGGGLGAYMHTFDADSRVSLFGVIVPVHIHALTDRHRVCPDILRRRSPSHRGPRGVRAHQERLRGLSRDRPAAEDRRRPEGRRGAVSVSRERRLVHRRPGQCCQLPGAGRDGGRRSRARDTGRARLQLGGARAPC